MLFRSSLQGRGASRASADTGSAYMLIPNTSIETIPGKDQIAQNVEVEIPNRQLTNVPGGYAKRRYQWGPEGEVDKSPWMQDGKPLSEDVSRGLDLIFAPPALQVGTAADRLSAAGVLLGASAAKLEAMLSPKGYKDPEGGARPIVRSGNTAPITTNERLSFHAPGTVPGPAVAPPIGTGPAASLLRSKDLFATLPQARNAAADIGKLGSILAPAPTIATAPASVMRIDLFITPSGEFDTRVSNVAKDVAVTVIDKRTAETRGGMR